MFFPKFLFPGLIAYGESASSNSGTLQATNTASPINTTYLQKETYSIQDINKMFRNGTATCSSLLEFYLDRIEKYDRNGPKLNSIIEVNNEAKTEAMNWDKKFLDCRSSQDSNSCFNQMGKLACIPILVKDNIATKEMTTASGSLALVGSIVPGDAIVIRNLRQEGAIILGKTGMTEWSAFRSQRRYGLDGWSARGGQAKNPYGSNLPVAGSSSGYGVAVAANLATVCVGVENFGSITSPARANGIYGFRPAAETISNEGIIVTTSDEDSAGQNCFNLGSHEVE